MFPGVYHDKEYLLPSIRRSTIVERWRGDSVWVLKERKKETFASFWKNSMWWLSTTKRDSWLGSNEVFLAISTTQNSFSTDIPPTPLLLMTRDFYHPINNGLSLIETDNGNTPFKTLHNCITANQTKPPFYPAAHPQSSMMRSQLVLVEFGAGSVRGFERIVCWRRVCAGWEFRVEWARFHMECFLPRLALYWC